MLGDIALAMYSACILAPLDNLNQLTPIAIFHLDVQVVTKISRSGVVRSAVAGSAYRAGAKLTGLDGKVYDYSRRKGVAESLIIAPEGLKDVSWGLIVKSYGVPLRSSRNAKTANYIGRSKFACNVRFLLLKTKSWL
jgi:hypothetical protein